jgi:hypothetical protein
MNMISTGAFLPETDASTKQNELVKKLTSAWEKKNSKTARAGGASLMALSLAACGGEDNTPYSAADVSAAEAAATTAALTGTDGTVYASVDAAVTSNDTAIADAARAEGVASVDITTDNQAAIDAAVAAVDLTTDNAAAIDAAVAADTAFASLADLVAAYDALANPAAVTAALTSSSETLIGTSSNDTFTGSSSTFAATDSIVDSSTTDADTATITLTAQNAAGTIQNIETVNFDWNAFGTAAVDLATVTGANVVNITSAKTGFLGSLNVTSANDNVVVAGSGMTGTVTATGVKTGGTLTADNASNVQSTANANATTHSTTVNAATATSVSVTDFATATVNAPAATSITVDDNGKTTAVTTLNVDAATTITTTATSATGKIVYVTAGDDSTAVTQNAIGASLEISGTGDFTLNSTGLTTETVTNSKTSGSLTVKSSTTTAENVASVSADTIWFTGNKAGADTVANGANLKYSGTGAIDVTVAGSGTTDSATVELTSATNTSLSLSGVETLNVTANAPLLTGTDMTISALNTDGNTVNISGTNDLVITLLEDGDNGATDNTGTVDASSLVGNFTVSGTDASEDLTLSGSLTGTNAITLSQDAATSSYTGGAGNDTVTSSLSTGALTALVGDGVNTVRADSATSGTLVVQSGSGVDTIDASAVDTGTVNINAGDGANVITVGDGDTITTATASITTGAGADTITVGTGVLNGATITVASGAGDDTVTLSGASTSVAGDTINISMGDGTGDTLVLDDGTDLGAGTITLNADIEVIKLATGDDNVNATFQASDLSGQSFTMKSSDGTTAVANTLGFTVEGAASTTTIDLSSLTIDQSITNAIYSTAITASAATGGVAITGTSVADTITGSGSADTITAGNGLDVITAGAGNDTIVITEATANQVKDVVTFSAASTNGQDTITGFKVGTDDMALVDGDTTDGTASGAAAEVGASSTALLSAAGAWAITTAFATSDLIEITTTLSSNGDLDAAIDGSELLKALSTSATGAATQITVANAAEKGYIAAYQDGSAYIYHIDAGAANTAVVASEMTLVATLDSITAGSLVAGDFVIA